MSALDDLFAQLDGGTATLRAQEERSLGSSKSSGSLGKLPTLTDAYLAKDTTANMYLVAGAKKEAQRLVEAGKHHRPAAFCTSTRSTGEFGVAQPLRPRVLEHWEMVRVIQPDRVFKNPKHYKGYFATPGTDLPLPHDGMCSAQHRTWLEGHHVRREREINSVAYAVSRINDLRADLKATSFAVQCSGSAEESKTLTAKAKALQKRLEKAKSAPALLPPPTPPGRVQHLRMWAGNELGPGRTFQQSSPWQARAEEREIGNRARTLRLSALAR